jgi:vacuolar-type H+-ATPase subunit E/Vma4
LDIIQFQEDITSISTKATQEANLKEQIENIKATWNKITFTVVWNEKCECYVLEELEEIYTALDESLANLNMILGSRFVAPLRVEAEQQKNYINTLSDMID